MVSFDDKDDDIFKEEIGGEGLKAREGMRLKRRLEDEKVRESGADMNLPLRHNDMMETEGLVAAGASNRRNLLIRGAEVLNLCLR